MIAQDVLRWLTVKALRGRTWAKGRVYDSPAQPADLRIVEERAPFIAVYVDDADFELDSNKLTEWASSTVHLVLEVAVADTATIPAAPTEPEQDQDTTDPDLDVAPTSGATQTIIANTDEALEANIGFITRQALQALSDSDNPWAALWMKLTTPGRRAIQIRRGGQGQDTKDQQAVRMASRVVRITVDLVGEPMWGEGVEAGSFWEELLQAVADDEELQGVGELLREHFEANVTPPQDQIDAARLTVPESTLRSLGAGKLVVPPAETDKPVEKITVQQEGTGHSFDVEADE